jgi:hypothetical protein
MVVCGGWHSKGVLYSKEIGTCTFLVICRCGRGNIVGHHYIYIQYEFDPLLWSYITPRDNGLESIISGRFQVYLNFSGLVVLQKKFLNDFFETSTCKNDFCIMTYPTLEA